MTKSECSCFEFRFFFVIVLSSFVIHLAGCGSKPPPPPVTHPAHGTVKYRDGAPLTAGMVQFISAVDPTVTISGPVDSSGHFELKTMHVNQNLPGAMAGSFQVTVMPFPTEASAITNPYTLPEPLVVKPGENTFEIVIERK